MVQQKEKPRAAPPKEQPQGERDAADYAARAAAIQNDPTLSDEQKRDATVALAKGMTGDKESSVSPQHYAAHLGTGGSGRFYPNGQPSELNVGDLSHTAPPTPPQKFIASGTGSSMIPNPLYDEQRAQYEQDLQDWQAVNGEGSENQSSIMPPTCLIFCKDLNSNGGQFLTAFYEDNHSKSSPFSVLFISKSDYDAMDRLFYNGFFSTMTFNKESRDSRYKQFRNAVQRNATDLDLNSEIGAMARIIFAEMGKPQDYDSYLKHNKLITKADREVVAASLMNRKARNITYLGGNDITNIIIPARYNAASTPEYTDTLNRLSQTINLRFSEVDFPTQIVQIFIECITISYSYLNYLVPSINSDLLHYVTDRSPNYYTDENNAGSHYIIMPLPQGCSSISAVANE